MELLDGAAVSEKLLEKLAFEIQEVKRKDKPLPKLSVLLVGEDPASQVYVHRKTKTAQKIGLLSEVQHFPSNTDERVILDAISRLNQDTSVHAILIQLPLPYRLDPLRILSQVLPEKDVDGFHPTNLGKLVMGLKPAAMPCTPAGIVTLLEYYNVAISGKQVVVVGRSNIVGKPLGMMLLHRDATVTFCHRQTRNLRYFLRQADIVIAATGVPGLITGDDVSPGVVVIDVGINRQDSKIVGDVHFESVARKAAYITPVPGGVGPMTIATLMANTLALYRLQTGAS